MRNLLILVATLLLSACGFQLRGSYTLPFDTVHIALPTTSELHAMLKRSIEASTKTRVVDRPGQAQVILTIAGDVQTKNILSLDTSGRVREFQLVRTVTYRVHDPVGHDWLPTAQVAIRRDIGFSDAQVLAKESEEALLWRDMQGDLAQQLLRRLSAARPPEVLEAAAAGN
ncbi:MAG: LPS assembly lipoprotein LptE [Sulfurisoma sp.]|nr:LPS assembly lipoprotein LptE [Sulfurisoma sp.]